MALLPTDIVLFEPTQQNAVGEVTRHGETYDFDFETGQFVDDGSGYVEILTDADSFAQGIEKVLRTRRSTFLIYGLDYGQDYGAYLDTNPADTITRTARLAGFAIEALKSHPQVTVVLSADVSVLDVSTNHIQVTGTVVDTFGMSLDFDHTLHA